MRLKRSDIAVSPRSAEFVRVSAQIEIETRGVTLDYWFDVPADLEEGLAQNGHAWAILMLPLACYFKEPLNLSSPIDRVLLDNLKGLSQVWAAWYPELKAIEINAPLVNEAGAAPDRGKRTVSCFSGGIDSFFTLTRHDQAVQGDGQSTIDDLLSVAGFNSAMEDFDRMRTDLGAAAENFGRRLVPILTNVRYGAQNIETPYSIARLMIGYAHIAVLAAAVHLLGKRYKEFIIPASHHYANLMPYGSHPLTDRLFSASDLSVVHDGASFTRIERTAVVARSDAALKTLHVCWQDFGDGNCSECQKCVRTMAALDILGARARAVSFDWSGYSLETIANIWLNNRSDCIHYVDIAQAAERLERPEVAKAAYRAVSYSTFKYRVLNVINALPFARALWRNTKVLRTKAREWRKALKKKAVPPRRRTPTHA